LQELKESNLISQAKTKGELFKTLLKHPLIKEVRGIGLMLALEFKDFKTVKSIIDQCIELGLITDWFLFCDNSLRIAPPLVITEDEIKIACKILLQAIDRVNKNLN
jgi:4-aminobutyrate aminotransferase-like enzyme